MTMSIAILIFVGWLIFIYLHGMINDHDQRIQRLERHKRDTPIVKAGLNESTKNGVQIEET